MSPDADLIIIGGGCAGLSLASRLAAEGVRCPRTIIIESRTNYTNDRTWCFWEDSRAVAEVPHRISHQWQTLKVSAGGRSVTMKADSPYQMLPADKFYADALVTIANNNRISLRLGSKMMSEPVKVRGENKPNNTWRIETSNGFVCGAQVIDTRPGSRPTVGGALLWQSFYGQEIECTDAIFDPACVDLMDFLEVRNGHIAFTYVLPLSSHRALVESTVFAVSPLTQTDLAAALKEAICARLKGAAFSVLREEQGVLPMGAVSTHQQRQQQHDPTYIRAGLTAGGARPATGYAFQRIQRWAASCARAIAQGRALVGHAPDPLMLRLMDRLFLQVIRAQPKLAPALFLAIFEHVAPSRIIRFLSDRGTFADYLAIIRALPPKPFLRQLVAPQTSTWSEPAPEARSEPRP